MGPKIPYRYRPVARRPITNDPIVGRHRNVYLFDLIVISSLSFNLRKEHVKRRKTAEKYLDEEKCAIAELWPDRIWKLS